MRFFFTLCCLALLSTTTVRGQLNKIEYQEYDLANGLHVILHQDKSTPIVAVSVMYHVGSKNENPERTGFAHFFEHLMLKEVIISAEGNTTNMFKMQEVH